MKSSSITTRTCRQARLILGAVLFLLCASQSAAWMRLYRQDDRVVAEADLIVVARLKEGTLRRVEHVYAKGLTKNTWEHHAVLLVSEVLKGDSKEKELPVIIHYGFEPTVGGIMSDGRADYPGHAKTPKDVVELVDRGDNFGGKVKGDIRHDHLWFLRNKPGHIRPADMPVGLGVIEPREVQHLELKPYYLALLSAKSEEALHKLCNDDTPAGRRALEQWKYLEVRQISLLPDMSERVRRLVPYFLQEPNVIRRPSGAGDELTKCGSIAAKALLPHFHRSKEPGIRTKIIGLWARLKAVELGRC